MSLALPISVLSISYLQIINVEQSFNITPILLSSACLAAASSPAPEIVIPPLTSM